MSVNGCGLTDLSDAVRTVPEAAIDELLDHYQGGVHDLAPGAGRSAPGARSWYGRPLVSRLFHLSGRRADFGASTDTFEDPRRLRQLPGIARPNGLMADVVTALAREGED